MYNEMQRISIDFPAGLPHTNGGAENAGVENAGGITYGKPLEQKTLKIPGV